MHLQVCLFVHMFLIICISIDVYITSRRSCMFGDVNMIAQPGICFHIIFDIIDLSKILERGKLPVLYIGSLILRGSQAQSALEVGAAFGGCPVAGCGQLWRGRLHCALRNCDKIPAVCSLEGLQSAGWWFGRKCSLHNAGLEGNGFLQFGGCWYCKVLVHWAVF